MSDQLSMFEGLDGTQPGDITEDRDRIGRPLTWQEACAHIGRLIWYCHILQSMTYWEAVIPERHLTEAIDFYHKNGEKLTLEKSDRLICYHGTKQRLLIDEFFCKGRYVYPEGNAFFAMRDSL